jgi:hypothetical protein
LLAVSFDHEFFNVNLDANLDVDQGEASNVILFISNHGIVSHTQRMAASLEGASTVLG